ncbi:hypothetical protein ACA910_012689 [Epithemia clementina (nom. ined.)]
MAAEPETVPATDAPTNEEDFEFGNFEDVAVAATTEDDAADNSEPDAPPPPSEDQDDDRPASSYHATETEDVDEPRRNGPRPPSRNVTLTDEEEEPEQEKKVEPELKPKPKPKREEKKPKVSKEPAKVQAADTSTNGGKKQSDPSKVEAEVCEAFFEWTNAWNSGNLFGYLDAYWDSDQTRYVSEQLAEGPHTKGGVVVTGRRDIDKVFTDMFVKNKKQQERQKAKKGVAGIMTLRKLIVTPTGGDNHDNAIVFGEYFLEVAGDKKGMSDDRVFTIHVQKRNNAWKIISEHATALPKK